jgi:hypothetical protein
MNDKKPDPRWQDLGEPVHAFDSTNGVVDVTEDQVPEEGTSEIDQAMWRAGQANIVMGGR